MSTAQPPNTRVVYPDKSGRLLLLGVFQILLGCLSGLMALLIVVAGQLTQLAQPGQGQGQVQAMNPQTMIIGLATYIALAVAFIWLGIGLARARRWARTLTVVLSWMWLILGIVGFVAMLFLMEPMTRALIAQQPQMPKEMFMVMQVVWGGFAACAYVVIPGVLLVFSRGESVRVTCLRRDPKVPWTDRIPMPVLALSLSLAITFASMALIVLNNSVLPLFGVFVSGATGLGVVVLIELILAYLTWGTYRLQMAAWWGTLLLGLVGALNYLITFTRTDLIAMYEKMNLPPDQLDMIRKMGITEIMTRWTPWLSVIGAAAWVGYMWYVRRYFVEKGKGTAAEDQELATSIT
jgi:hypothetical protein